MQRAVNPLPDRLAFFWHRHWAISREDGLADQWMLQLPQPAAALRGLRPLPERVTFRDLALRDDDHRHGDVACT